MTTRSTWHACYRRLADFITTHNRLPTYEEHLPDGHPIGEWTHAAMVGHTPSVERERIRLHYDLTHPTATKRQAAEGYLTEYAQRRALLEALPHWHWFTY